MDNLRQSTTPESKASTSEGLQLSAKSPKSFYGKRNWKKWVVICILIGVLIYVGSLVYASVYYFLSKQGLKPYSSARCPLEAKICPDGSSVGRTGPNCEFVPCPTPKSASIPDISSVDISNWKTYMDTEIGIQFKRPKGSNITVNVMDIQPKESLETWLQAIDDECNRRIVSQKNLKLELKEAIVRESLCGHRQMISYIRRDADTVIISTWFPENHASWQTLSTEDIAVFYKILSTLRFLDQSREGKANVWNVYEGESYSFQYPSGWSIREFDRVIYVKNLNKTVAIGIFPEQLPYGFEGKSIVDKNSLDVTVEGKTYTTSEFIRDKRTAYVDLTLKKREEYHILFGTGYPTHTEGSLTDYYASRDIILKILSTLKINDY